jgi:hypothetical protein
MNCRFCNAEEKHIGKGMDGPVCNRCFRYQDIDPEKPAFPLGKALSIDRMREIWAQKDKDRKPNK